mgnify:CR=1 FL=1
MRIGILAEKLGMSRYYDKNSTNQAVTLLKVSNCRVISIQSKDKNGYNSITLSHGKSKNPSKPFKVFFEEKVSFAEYDEDSPGGEDVEVVVAKLRDILKKASDNILVI